MAVERMVSIFRAGAGSGMLTACSRMHLAKGDSAPRVADSVVPVGLLLDPAPATQAFEPPA
jgi:hypothetical protein